MARGNQRGGNQRKSKTINPFEKAKNEAVKLGLESIIDDNKRFTGNERFLINYIDPKELDQVFDYVKDEIYNKSGSWGEKEFKALVGNVAHYISKGGVFNKTGKEIILKTGLKKQAKGFFGSGVAKKILMHDNYLDDVTGAFNDIYNLMKTGDYAKRMPKLYKSVNEIYDMGFASAALDIFYHSKLVNKKDYASLKGIVTERAKQGGKEAKKDLIDYIIPRKMAASILAIAGIGVILSTNSITGAVIGTTQTNPFALIGGTVSLILGTLLWIKKK